MVRSRAVGSGSVRLGVVAVAAAVFLLDHFPEDRRQRELLERGDFGLELAHDDGLPAILLENVNAKAGEVRKVVSLMYS